MDSMTIRNYKRLLDAKVLELFYDLQNDADNSEIMDDINDIRAILEEIEGA